VRVPLDSDGVEQVVAGDENRFQHGRKGDYLITPFQCELCHFRNIQKRSPVKGDARDDRVIMLMRRANLDALWSRESSTVAGSFRNITKLEKISENLGMTQVIPSMGPFALKDEFGMHLAICLLERSLDGGRNERLVQFNTVRQLRSAYSNAYHASREHIGGVSTFALGSKKLLTTNCPSYGMWYDRFMVGFYKRVGELLVQDTAISIEILHAVQTNLEDDWSRCDTMVDRLRVAELGFIFVVGFCTGLRGEELMMIDLAGCLKHQSEALAHKTPHVVIALWGRFKGVKGEAYHLMPVVQKTATGLRPGDWFERLLSVLKEAGLRNGKVLRGTTGGAAKIGHYAEGFHQCLEQVQETSPDLMEMNVDVREDYGLSRSCRRGVTTHARNQGVEPQVVEANNRWRKEERARGGNPHLSMMDYYTDIKQSLPLLLKFSAPL
jgi:hypothetical protein